MKIDFKGITGEEISFKLNRVKIAPDDKLDIKPQFSRQVRKVTGNDKLNFVALSVKIESTEEEPKPFNVKRYACWRVRSGGYEGRRRRKKVCCRGNQACISLPSRNGYKPYGKRLYRAFEFARNKRTYLSRG